MSAAPEPLPSADLAGEPPTGWGAEGLPARLSLCKPQGKGPTKKPVHKLLNEKGKQRLTEMREERDSGPEPTPLGAKVPESLTFGKDLAWRSQGFGTGLLPAPGTVKKKRKGEENDSAEIKRNVFLKRKTMRGTKE